MEQVDLVIEQGTTWGIAFPVLDLDGNEVDLTGWSARAQVRPKAGDSTLYFDWGTSEGAAGRASVENGRVSLFVDPEQSSAWTWRRGTWDLELIGPDGSVARPVGGRVRVDPEVTR